MSSRSFVCVCEFCCTVIVCCFCVCGLLAMVIQTTVVKHTIENFASESFCNAYVITTQKNFSLKRPLSPGDQVYKHTQKQTFFLSIATFTK